MAFVKTLLVLGLAAVSPFSMAQEIVVPGNNNAPYQPPAWFVRMAKPEAKFPEPIDGFLVDSRTSFPRVRRAARRSSSAAHSSSAWSSGSMCSVALRPAVRASTPRW